MICFSTSSYTVFFFPSTNSFTLLPSASFLATLAVTVTVSKLSFSRTAIATRPSAILRISFAFASVVTILPLYNRFVTWFLNRAFLWSAVLLNFLYFAILFSSIGGTSIHACSVLLYKCLGIPAHIC